MSGPDAIPKWPAYLSVGALLCAGVLYLGWSSSRPSGPALLPESPGRGDVLVPEGLQGMEGRTVLDVDRQDVRIPAGNAGRWALQIEGDSGFPVAGARVDRWGVDGTEYVGSCDERGVLFIEEAGPQTIIVSHPGYATRSDWVDALEGEQHSVRLAPEGRIRGRVVGQDGGAVGAGWFVLAWETTRGEPASRHASRALAGDPSTFLCSTDQEGSFEIGSLTPGTKYTLGAAGYGALSGEPLAGIVPGDENVVLAVEAAYGILVRLADADGGPMRASSRGSRGLIIQLPSESDGLRFGSSTLRHLLFPDRTERAADEVLIVVTATDGRSAVEGLRVRARYPGYDPLDVEVVAFPLHNGLAQYDVSLMRRVDGFGNLVLTFLRCPLTAAGSSRTLFPEGHVSLLSDEGSTLEYFLSGFSDREERIEGIPFGSYRILVSAASGSIVHPVPGEDFQTIAIGIDPVHLALDLGHLAALELDVLDESGDAYSGPIQLLLGKGFGIRPGAGGMVFFESRPYRFSALAPGTYALFGLLPSLASADGQNLQEIELEPGQHRRLSLVLR